MKTLCRWLFNGLSTLSLLILGIIVIFWIRSYWVWDMPSVDDLPLHDADGKWVRLYFSSVNGGIGMELLHQWDDTNRYSVRWDKIKSSPGCIPYDGPLYFGFKLDLHADPIADRSWKVVVPDWSVALLTATMPTLRLRRSITRRRRWLGKCRKSEGRCPVCGYDIRSSEGRCSECGTPIPVGTKKA